MLKFFLSGHGSTLPAAVLVAGVLFFVLVIIYLVTDGRSRHRKHMESLPWMERPDMADDNKLKSHSFDGIHEYDNDLPRWWLVTLWATVFWAALYVMWHAGGAWLGPVALADEQNSAAAAQAKNVTGPLPEPVMRLLSHEPDRREHGKELYAKALCATCHGPDATGLVGPNLRDDLWIYGSDMTTLVESITMGRANGLMPAQGRILSRGEIIDLAVFIAANSREAKAQGKPPDANREKLQPITY